jgi:hypothetical protein
MRSLTRSIRVLALIPLLFALPLLGGGAVCIPLDGVRAADAGSCACVAPPVAGSEAAIGLTAADDCGPCHDVVLDSIRAQVRADETAPALLVADAPSFLPALARSPRPAPRARFADPPATRLPILRC